MKINRINIFNNLTIHHKSKSENTTGGIWSESDFEIDYLLFFYIEMDFHFLLIFVDKVNSVRADKRDTATSPQASASSDIGPLSVGRSSTIRTRIGAASPVAVQSPTCNRGATAPSLPEKPSFSRPRPDRLNPTTP